MNPKSLFRNTLSASFRESILCMGPCKVLKTGDLRIKVTTMQSILCRQSIHTKYFTGGGGGVDQFQVSSFKVSSKRG